MALRREKRLNLLGMELTAAMDAHRADRITHSVWWRYLGRPSVRLLQQGVGRGGTNGSATAVQPAPLHVASRADSETAALQVRISQVPWYHTIDLGHGVVTPGLVDNRAEVATSGIPDDLRGKRCLDVGTFDGFWAFEMERRGAEVVALDLASLEEMDFTRRRRVEHAAEAVSIRGSQDVGDAFALAREVLGSRVQREILSVYDLSPDELGKFDVVLLGDVIVHLRDPELALERVYSVTRGVALVASAVAPELERHQAPLIEYLGQRNLYWVWWNYSALALIRMMEDAGFEPVDEVSRMQVHNRAGEFVKVMLKGRVPESPSWSSAR